MTTEAGSGPDQQEGQSESSAYIDYRKAYDAAKLRDVPFETMSGVPVEPVYGDAPYPGQYPYTRGVYPSMYRSRLWTMRMFAGFGTAEDTNGRFQGAIGQRGDRLVNRLRHADADGPRLRQPVGSR